MARRQGEVRRGRSEVKEAKGRRGQESSRGSQEVQGQHSDTTASDESSRQVTPKLTLVASPIGNLGDISPRASIALSEADFWIVEDTRISAKLAFHLGIKKTMRVAHDHSEDFQLEKLLEEIESGKHAVLLTDGGAPGISDPGARLTDLAHNRGIEVDGIPGPSAVINALMLSGFYAQRFAFLGFLGRTPGDMKKELEIFRESPYTIVLFESPFRFKNLLKAAGEVLGDRRYAICREITKKNQQVFRSELPTIPSETDVPSKGEFTIVIEGRRKKLERQKYVNILVQGQSEKN